MELSVKIAQKIIDELDKTMDRKFNMINSDGIIFASNDKSRIGAFHAAAKNIVDYKLDQVIVQRDGEFEGAVRGLNFPIYLEGEIVAVLGITGNYEDIKDTALIVKRMTELLLKDNYDSEQRLSGENIRNHYLSKWLEGNHETPPEVFARQGLELGIDILTPRRIMVVSVYDGRRYEAFPWGEQAEGLIKQMVSNDDPHNLYLKTAAYLVCIITRRNDERMMELAKRIQDMVYQQYSFCVAIGVDVEDRSNQYSTKRAYLCAMRAAQSAARGVKSDICFYSSLDIELFSGEISCSTKQDYIRKIFKTSSPQEIQDALTLLDILYQQNGSIQQTADRLFVHKNTVQYRLNAIAERTGYDPRTMSCCPLFYLASSFSKDLQSDMGNGM